jgi:hypothetical protein
MHKSKPSKHNLVLDRQKAKEFMRKREELKQKRLTNVRETDNGKLVHSTGRKMENDNV